MKTNSLRLALKLAGWLARILVVGVFALWGAFFVEHTQEWFVAPFPQLPPLKVCLGHGLHLLLLVGLLVSLRWPNLGGVWTIVTAFAFFIGHAGARFPVFFGLTILPVLLLWFCGWLGREQAAEGDRPEAAPSMP